jgi:hypothetical protein
MRQVTTEDSPPRISKIRENIYHPERELSTSESSVNSVSASSNENLAATEPFHRKTVAGFNENLSSNL